MDIKKLQFLAYDIRKDIVEMLHHAGSGHSGGSLGMTDIFTVLYFDIMKNFSSDPKSEKRDYVILSNGHICPVLYATLSKRGYFDRDDLFTLRKLGSRLQGHPHFVANKINSINNSNSHNNLAGIENSSGPLGQGISQAVGLAASLKRDKKKNGVYCFVGDGELQEGQCYESFLFAGKEKLSNLTVIVDYNNIQIDGKVEDVLPLGEIDEMFLNYSFSVIDFDGNDIEQIKFAFEEAKKIKDKPVCLIARTIPGKGVSFMENDYTWHGKTPNSEQTEIALREIEEFQSKILQGGKK